jgi:hypothetical protein
MGLVGLVLVKSEPFRDHGGPEGQDGSTVNLLEMVRSGMEHLVSRSLK